MADLLIFLEEWGVGSPGHDRGAVSRLGPRFWSGGWRFRTTPRASGVTTEPVSRAGGFDPLAGRIVTETGWFEILRAGMKELPEPGRLMRSG